MILGASVQPKGSIVNNPDYVRGLRIIERRDGQVLMTYVENSDSPFRSPVVSEQVFQSWSEVMHFMAIWEALQYIRFW